MPPWVLQLKCYDGTDPDNYRRKVEGKEVTQIAEEGRRGEEEGDSDSAIKILRRVVAHSMTHSSAEHRENKEHLASVNWLWMEKEGHKKSSELHDVLSRSFGYYFKKKEIKLLLKYFMRPNLGFDILFFFRQFASIVKNAEEKHGISAVNEDAFNPIWTQTMQHIEYVTLCNDYLKRCENKVRDNTLIHLKQVLLARANSRFQRSVETMLGELNHFTFRREINRVLDMTLSLTKANTLFSYFDRKNVGVLNGEEVSKELIYMTIDLQKAPKKQAQQQTLSPQENYENDSKCLVQQEQGSSNSSDVTVKASQAEEDLPPPPPPPLDNLQSPRQKPKTKQSSKELFNQTIIKISTCVSSSLQQGSFTPLDIPDGFVSESFVRTALLDQLGIRLSKQEVFSLCERLRRGNDTSATATTSTSLTTKSEQKKSANADTDTGAERNISGTVSILAPFLPRIDYNNNKNKNTKLKNRNDSEKPKNIILGKHVKVFITSIKQMCNKRVGVGTCKPLFAK